jgi:hypothetical protein
VFGSTRSQNAEKEIYENVFVIKSYLMMLKINGSSAENIICKQQRKMAGSNV